MASLARCGACCAARSDASEDADAPMASLILEDDGLKDKSRSSARDANAHIAGRYSDPNHPDGYRLLEVDGVRIKVTSLDGPGQDIWHGSGELTEPGKIDFDFSEKDPMKPVLKSLKATYNGDRSITFMIDNNTWTKVQDVSGRPGSKVLRDHEQSAEKAYTQAGTEGPVANGAVYVGQWKGAQSHGQGVLTRPDGSRYEGNFVDGYTHGEGKFIAPNGNVYDGQWDQDSAHGFGKYTHEDGSIYEGQWVHDEKSGKGVERWPDGARYEGEFLCGSKHGNGQYTSSMGTIIYSGQFSQDRMHGEGTYHFLDGRTYAGRWQVGQMWGQGAMCCSDGSRYEGQYFQGVRHGEGTLNHADGHKYRGQWLDGKEHGRGVIIDAYGAEVAGNWCEGFQLLDGEGV